MSSVSTWLYKIARNVYLKEQRRTRGLSQLEREFVRSTPDHEPPAQDTLIEKQWLKKIVNEVLRTLPEQYRTVILLKEVENLSHRQISEIMGKSEASTKVLLFRAKQRFKEEYDRLGGSSYE